MSAAPSNNGAHLPSVDKMWGREGLQEQDYVTSQKKSPVPALPARPNAPTVCDAGRDNLSATISVHKGNTSLFLTSYVYPQYQGH